MLLAVPALLYAINNYLKFTMQVNSYIGSLSICLGFQIACQIIFLVFSLNIDLILLQALLSISCIENGLAMLTTWVVFLGVGIWEPRQC